MAFGMSAASGFADANTPSWRLLLTEITLSCLEGVCNVLDTGTRRHRRTRVFGFGARFNDVRSDEVLNAGALVIRMLSG